MVPFTMLGHVIESLLNDPVKSNLQWLRDLLLLDPDSFFDPDRGVDFLKFPAEPVEGYEDSKVVEHGGPEVHLDSPDFGGGIPEHGEQVFQRRNGITGIPPAHLLQDIFCPKYDCSQGLADAVMNLPGDIPSLRFLGRQELGGKEPALSL